MIVNLDKNTLLRFPAEIKIGQDGKALELPPDIPASKELPPCENCEWNIKNKCEHPAQNCKPCKQGAGLMQARRMAGFHCPGPKLKTS